MVEGISALALETTPPFDRYVFIESDPERCAQLENLRTEFPTDNITIIRGDANQVIQDLCKNKNWQSHRAMLFLDPYGFRSMADDRSDRVNEGDRPMVLWPLAMGVNRMLTKSGDIPPSWRQSLDRLLGRTDWYDAFYRVEVYRPVWNRSRARREGHRRDDCRYLNDRLRTVFPTVADNPRVLRNSRGKPLYLLCFATGANEKGARVALRIASHILKHA